MSLRPPYATNAGSGDQNATPIEPTTVELKRMFVLAELRGRGIAARLVSALEDWARELGYARVAVDWPDLIVRKGNCG